MTPRPFFLDTHDRTRKTFPEKRRPEELGVFFARFEKACYEEDVVPLRTDVSYADGRTMRCPAPGGGLTVKHREEEVHG